MITEAAGDWQSPGASTSGPGGALAVASGLPRRPRGLLAELDALLLPGVEGRPRVVVLCGLPPKTYQLTSAARR